MDLHGKNEEHFCENRFIIDSVTFLLVESTLPTLAQFEGDHINTGPNHSVASIQHTETGAQREAMPCVFGSRSGVTKTMHRALRCLPVVSLRAISPPCHPLNIRESERNAQGET